MSKLHRTLFLFIATLVASTYGIILMNTTEKAYAANTNSETRTTQVSTTQGTGPLFAHYGNNRVENRLIIEYYANGQWVEVPYNDHNGASKPLDIEMDKYGEWLFYALAVYGNTPQDSYVEIHKVDLVTGGGDTVIHVGGDYTASIEVLSPNILLISEEYYTDPNDLEQRRRDIVLYDTGTTTVLHSERHTYGIPDLVEEETYSLDVSPIGSYFLLTDNYRIDPQVEPYNIKIFRLNVGNRVAKQVGRVSSNGVWPTWVSNSAFVYRDVDALPDQTMYIYNVFTETSSPLSQMAGDASFTNFNPERGILYDYGPDINFSIERQIALYNPKTGISTAISGEGYTSPLWTGPNSFVTHKIRECAPDECPPWFTTIPYGYAFFTIQPSGSITKIDVEDEERLMFQMTSKYDSKIIFRQSSAGF